MHKMYGAALAAMLVGCGGSSSGTGTEGPADGTSSTSGVAPTTGSGSTSTTTTTSTSTTGEESTTGEVAGCGDTAAPTEPIAWDPGQPDIAGCEVRGQRDYRAIIHVHSHHSHDACDGDPQPGGVPDE